MYSYRIFGWGLSRQLTWYSTERVQTELQRLASREFQTEKNRRIDQANLNIQYSVVKNVLFCSCFAQYGQESHVSTFK